MVGQPQETPPNPGLPCYSHPLRYAGPPRITSPVGKTRQRDSTQTRAYSNHPRTNNRILLKRQVDDFAIAAPDAKTADILLDLIDNKLKIPVKRQGYLGMYNGRTEQNNLEN